MGDESTEETGDETAGESPEEESDGTEPEADERTGAEDDDPDDAQEGAEGAKKAMTEEPPEDEVKEIEEERERRLDPENRPNNAEVDNTQRDFDFEEGEFTDDGRRDRHHRRGARETSSPNRGR